MFKHVYCIKIFIYLFFYKLRLLFSQEGCAVIVIVIKQYCYHISGGARFKIKIGKENYADYSVIAGEDEVSCRPKLFFSSD